MGRPLQHDLTGQTMGRLTVIRRDTSRGPKVYWYCRCSCGNHTSIQTYDLLFKVRSCGCYRDERAREVHSKDRSAFAEDIWNQRIR